MLAARGERSGDLGLRRGCEEEVGGGDLAAGREGERRKALERESAFEMKERQGGGKEESASSVSRRARRMRVMVESVTERGWSSCELVSLGAKWLLKLALPPKG